MDYKEGLKLGKVIVRSAFQNPNKEAQVGVQFMQTVKGSSEPTNKLLAISQGFSEETTLSCVESWSKEQAIKIFGEAIFNHSEEGDNTAIFAEDIYGVAVAISVVENTTKNPKQPGQIPKENPKTKKVCKYLGAPIYRHCKLVPAGEEVREFMYSKEKEDSTSSETISIIAKESVKATGQYASNVEESKEKTPFATQD